MFTMNDFANFQNGNSAYDDLDIAIKDDGKLYVNGILASKSVTKLLMKSPLVRSILEIATYQFNEPKHAPINNAVRKLLKKHI